MKTTALICTLATILFFPPEVLPLTRVTLYDHNNFGGSTSLLNDLDTASYYYLTNFNDKTSSFKINYGSCVEMFMDTPPNYNNDWFWATTLDFSGIAARYNDRISSIKGCGTTTKTMLCPVGTFVKKVDWDGISGMTNGVSIGCYQPGSVSPTSTLRSHGSGTLSMSGSCTALRGISYSWDERRRADVGLAHMCAPGSSGPHKIMCGSNQAVSGMQLSVENRSGFIKVSTLYCSDIGKVESICRASDKADVLFTCDASGALYPLKCSFSKKVGYEKKSSMSETESREFTFYSEYGFEIGAAGYGLSANFKATLGTSNTTGYSWTRAEESTWSLERTVSVEAEAPAGCVTRVSEIAGSCSFMVVRPSYFQRNDSCSGISFLTNVIIPEDQLMKTVFVSRIPDKVLKFIKERDGGKIVDEDGVVPVYNLNDDELDENLGEEYIKSFQIKEQTPVVK